MMGFSDSMSMENTQEMFNGMREDIMDDISGAGVCAGHPETIGRGSPPPPSVAVLLCRMAYYATACSSVGGGQQAGKLQGRCTKSKLTELPQGPLMAGCPL